MDYDSIALPLSYAGAKRFLGVRRIAGSPPFLLAMTSVVVKVSRLSGKRSPDKLSLFPDTIFYDAADEKQNTVETVFTRRKICRVDRKLERVSEAFN